jgi:hypothetical protein
MADGGGIEISDFEQIPGREGPLSVLVPVIEGTGRHSAVAVEVGRDVSLTRSLVTEISDEQGLSEVEIATRIANTFGSSADEIVREDAAMEFEVQYDDVYRAALSERYTLPSSLVRGGDRWQITDIAHEAAGAARISFGRRGRHELAMTVDGDVVGDFKRGDPLLGPELLWEGRSGPLGLGKAVVEFVPDPDPPQPVPIWVPLMRLHRPQGEGCKVTYTSESQTSENLMMTVKILGVGAEGGFRVGVNLLDEYVASSACMETVIPAKLQWRPGKTVVNGTEVAYGLHAKVIDLDPDKKKPRPVPAADDDCGRSGAALDGLATRPYDESELPPDDIHAFAIGVEADTYGRLSLGLEMAGGVPIKVGMDYERSTQQKTTLRVELAGGTCYHAYAPVRRTGAELEQHLEICWTTAA